MAKKIDELQESLRKKDEDMKQMEERYKRYVEKARTVSLPKQNLNISSAYGFKVEKSTVFFFHLLKVCLPVLRSIIA